MEWVLPSSRCTAAASSPTDQLNVCGINMKVSMLAPAQSKTADVLAGWLSHLHLADSVLQGVVLLAQVAIAEVKLQRCSLMNVERLDDSEEGCQPVQGKVRFLKLDPTGEVCGL